MNNGHTRESKHRIAVLEDEEVETFVAFCEYAYTCDYTTPSFKDSDHSPWKGQVRQEPSPAENQEARLEEAGGIDVAADPTLGGDAAAAELPAEQTPAEEGPGDAAGDGEGASEGKKGKKGKKSKKRAGGVSFDDSAHLTPPSTPPPEKTEDLDKPVADTSSGVTEWWDQPEEKPAEVKPAEGIIIPTDQPPAESAAVAEEQRDGEQEQINMPFGSSVRPKGLNLWDDFSALHYVHQRPVGAPARGASPKPGSSDLPYILFHAKLYVFATRYVIPQLAQLCLRKLHRDLLHLQFSWADQEAPGPEGMTLFDVKAKMVLDLMHYTFTKTTRYEPAVPAAPTMLRESELRKLVTHYAACKVRELAAYTPPMAGAFAVPPPLSLDGVATANVPVVGGLRDLLDTTTELASDLVYKLM